VETSIWQFRTSDETATLFDGNEKKKELRVGIKIRHHS
jgi:hypothetical protein